MDCFLVKYPSGAVEDRVIVHSADGYAMNLPRRTHIKVLNDDGTVHYKVIESLVAGDRLILNTRLPQSPGNESSRAKAWLLGAILPLSTVIPGPVPVVSVATPRADFVSAILVQVSKTKCQNSYVTSRIDADGVYRMQSPVFAQVFEKFAIDPERGIVSASYVQLAKMSRSQKYAFITGLYTSGGVKLSDDSCTLPATTQNAAAFLMNALLKMKIRAARNSPTTILITGRENIAGLSAIIAKYKAHVAEDAEVAMMCDGPIVPGYGSRAPSPLPDASEAPAAPVPAAAAIPPPAFMFGQSAGFASTAKRQSQHGLFADPVQFAWGAMPLGNSAQCPTTPFEKIEPVPKAPTK